MIKVETGIALESPYGDINGDGLANPESIPAEYLADSVTSSVGLRVVAWERFRNSQHVLTDAINKGKHIITKVGPGGKVVLIGGASVLGMAGVAYLCTKLLRHRHNPLKEKNR